MAKNSISIVVDKIKEAGLADAALFWFAFKFINGHCKKNGKLCKNFPPDDVCDAADCVHAFLKEELGVDMPAITPKKRKETGDGKEAGH